MTGLMRSSARSTSFYLSRPSHFLYLGLAIAAAVASRWNRWDRWTRWPGQTRWFLASFLAWSSNFPFAVRFLPLRYIRPP